MLKKLSVLFLFTSSLLTSCNDDNKFPLLSNSDYLLYGSIVDDRYFYEPTIEVFDNLYNSDLNYIIFFSEKGCSACENFEPIIEKYARNFHQLILKIDGQDKYKIQEKYKTKFFPDTNVLTPSIFVKEKGDNIHQVNYSSYMGTYGAFSNHMSIRYKTSKCAYFSEEIPGKSPIISKYTFVNFQSNDAFKNRILTRLLDTKNDVLIHTDFNENFISIFVKNPDGNFDECKTTKITNDITDEIINEYF